MTLFPKDVLAGLDKITNPAFSARQILWYVLKAANEKMMNCCWLLPLYGNPARPANEDRVYVERTYIHRKERVVLLVRTFRLRG